MANDPNDIEDEAEHWDRYCNDPKLRKEIDQLDRGFIALLAILSFVVSMVLWAMVRIFGG